MSGMSRGCWGRLTAQSVNAKPPALDWVPPIICHSASRQVWVVIKDFLKDFPDKAGRSKEVADVPTLCSSMIPVPLLSFPPSPQVPPAPLTPPRLLAKQSRQLVVSPVDCFSGDGPITSIKLLYKPKDDTSAWSSIVGMCLPGGGGQENLGRRVWLHQPVGVWGGQRFPSQDPHGDAEVDAGGGADCRASAWF